ncbi:putative membrane protein YphA (DoxX/SURF4 family) [Nocardioides sp. BE266]|uniref:DoxX family protein n=1 Tax=Nocardioides sp. BE266 TaxID=2817725 RepID=UPI002858F314|nr:DoxX family protein [Nocardioides sp. BE266]MDR7251292.1 putative membrane protein YphA (DoxX/SURF4 family) [Nocardioides sp. BE266]
MNIALWVVAILLAGAFAMAGVLKSTKPKEAIVEQGLAWAEDFSQPVIRFIGAMELLGAIGLVLPPLVGVAEILTPLAATGLAVTMALAAVTHLRRKEPQMVVVNAVLLALAAFVAWGRFGPYSF